MFGGLFCVVSFSIITRARVSPSDIHPLLVSTVIGSAGAGDSAADPADVLAAQHGRRRDAADATATHPCFSVHRLVQEVVRDNSWRQQSAAPRRGTTGGNALAVAVTHADGSAGLARGGAVPQPTIVEAALSSVCRAVSSRAQFLALWLVDHVTTLVSHIPASTVGTVYFARDDDAFLARSVRGASWIRCLRLLASWRMTPTVMEQVLIAFSRIGELAARHLSDLPSGERLCDWALDVARSVYADAPHWNVAMTIHNTALVKQMREKFDEAEDLYAANWCCV